MGRGGVVTRSRGWGVGKGECCDQFRGEGRGVLGPGPRGGARGVVTRSRGWGGGEGVL